MWRPFFAIERDRLGRRAMARPGRKSLRSWAVPLGAIVVSMVFFECGCAKQEPERARSPMKLSHEQTLQWVREHRAWRKAQKTKPIWARAIEPDEIGKEYKTADHATENAQEGHWLCVGVAEEPWFQKPEKVEAKYVLEGEEEKQFDFDSQPHTYRIYKPKEGVRNWAAQVEGKGIEGFHVRPSYDMEHPLYAPAGGYVVTEDVPDPYAEKLADAAAN